MTLLQQTIAATALLAVSQLLGGFLEPIDEDGPGFTKAPPGHWLVLPAEKYVVTPEAPVLGQVLRIGLVDTIANARFSIYLRAAGDNFGPFVVLARGRTGPTGDAAVMVTLHPEMADDGKRKLSLVLGRDYVLKTHINADRMRGERIFRLGIPVTKPWWDFFTRNVLAHPRVDDRLSA